MKRSPSWIWYSKLKIDHLLRAIPAYTTSFSSFMFCIKNTVHRFDYKVLAWWLSLAGGGIDVEGSNSADQTAAWDVTYKWQSIRTAAGQARAALHTMAVLHAYQADLLKDQDQGQGLRRWQNCATLQTLLSVPLNKLLPISESLNLADIGGKERNFILYAPVSALFWHICYKNTWLQRIKHKHNNCCTQWNSIKHWW